MRSVRYKIEYLANASDQNSVCHVKRVGAGSLADAQAHALDGSFGARRLFEAVSFQIRDMDQDGQIVSAAPIKAD